MSTQREHAGPESEPPFDIDDPSLRRFDLVREGARRDGVEIVHYAPKFPVPGTKAEKRVERSIAMLLALSGLAAIGFVVAFVALPFEYEPGRNLGKYFTPILGLGLGGALLLLGMAIIAWAKKLLPDEVSVQERHDGPSPRDEQELTGSTIVNMLDETGVQRRPLLKGALLLPALGLGAAAIVPLGALIRDPHRSEIFFYTGWSPKNNGGKPVRLIRDDGTPIRPEDVSVGGQMTVFPDIPEGTTNKWADSPTLLIHLRQEDADVLRRNLKRVPLNAGFNNGTGGMWGNFVAYSKICTHAGCPASLYEQQTNRLLCPCHQSQFQITDNARPIFGPATRRLPMLPLAVEDGYLIATDDFGIAIGPAFWERP